MFVVLHQEYIAFCPDARVDDGQVHAALREITVRTADPEAGFRRPLRGNVVDEVDHLCIRKASDDHAFHNGRERPLVAEAAARPVDENRVDCRDNDLEDVLGCAECERSFQIHRTPPDNERVYGRVEQLRCHGRAVVAHPEPALAGPGFDLVKCPHVEALAYKVGKQRAENEARRKVEDG